MSLALSALVKPSRAHRALLAACGLVHSVLAMLLAGDPGQYLGAPVLALAPALAAVLLLRAAAGRSKMRQIDVSGTGDLRVTVKQDVHAMRGAMEREWAGAPQDAEPGIRLLPGSVVWPWLMVLRYGAPEGDAHVLIVWRDALDAASWRGLAVALVAIGRRGDADAAQVKIR